MLAAYPVQTVIVSSLLFAARPNLLEEQASNPGFFGSQWPTPKSLIAGRLYCMNRMRHQLYRRHGSRIYAPYPSTFPG
jgi:hypothetical protein